MEHYLKLSQRPSHAYLMGLVLLLLYEGLAALFIGRDSGASLNLIDVLFDQLLTVLPFSSYWLLGMLVAVAVLLIALDQREGYALERRVLLGMLAESLGWALLLLLLLPLVAGMLFPGALAAAVGAGRSLLQDFILSLGAGFYEELFFRLLLVRALVFVAVLLGYSPGNVFTRLMLALLTAVTFSLAHHLSEPFEVYAFLYRTLFGLLMSLLLLYRGFGVTSWTHALYDVLVFALRA